MHRLSLLRDLTHPDQLRAAWRPSPAPGPDAPGPLGGAVRCGIAVTLTFVLLAVTGHADLTGFASLGALASLYGRDEPYPWRWRLMTLAGLSLTVSAGLCSALAWLDAPAAVQLVLVALVAACATSSCTALRTGPPGGTIIVFAAGTGMSPVAQGVDVLTRTAATATGAGIAVLVCTAGLLPALLRNRPMPDPPRPSEAARAALADPTVRTSAALVLTGALAAGIIVTLAGWDHPAWAAMGATAVLQGRNVHHMGQRAVQRAVGTLGGAALAFPLLAADLPFWAVAVLVIALQTATEVVVCRHYGAAMLTITPMALLMTSNGSVAADPMHLAADRILDTLVGALVGVLVAVAAARPPGSELHTLQHLGDQRGDR